MNDTAKPKQTCILLCEDEMLVAMMLQDRLESAGYRILTAPRVARGLELADSEAIDAALVDINMADEYSFPIAEKLRQRGIPFVFSSGYDEEWLPEEWKQAKILRKPYDTKTVTATIEQLIHG